MPPCGQVFRGWEEGGGRPPSPHVEPPLAVIRTHGSLVPMWAAEPDNSSPVLPILGQPQQSVTSLDHLLAGFQSPSTIPSNTVFTSRLSFIVQMCLNALPLLYHVHYYAVSFYLFSLTILLLTSSFQHIYNSLLY